MLTEKAHTPPHPCNSSWNIFSLFVNMCPQLIATGLYAMPKALAGSLLYPQIPEPAYRIVGIEETCWLFDII